MQADVSTSQVRASVKVPAVTGMFWVIKVLTTGMGETTSDYLNKRFDPITVVPVAALAFVAALIWQLRTVRYRPVVYWLTVVLVSVFGTMCADVLHVRFDVSYAVSTLDFAVVLAALFALWHRVEGTLSIHSISTGRRELFYWATVW